MKTEQELKDKCTPEFIKWMCEYAEGFEFIKDSSWAGGYYITTKETDYYQWSYNSLESDDIVFPLLIHRAVEGWNKTNDLKIRIFDEEIHTKKRLDHFAIGFYQFKNYQPQSLTQAECTMLHCLLDVFKKQEERDE